MDNQGTPVPRNSRIRTYVANQKKQDPSICWPFRVRYEYSDILDQSCRVHLSNRRVPENVEASEPLVVRRNTEGANVVDENHRGNIGNGSASNPVMELANVSSCPNEDIVDEGAQTEALDVVRGNELVYNGIGTLSENEADIGNGCLKRKFEGKKPKMAKPAVAGGKGLSRSGRLLKPTLKLLQFANSTGAPAGEGTSGSEREQPKRIRLNAIIARATSMPRIPAETKGNQHNHHQSGVANPNGSGIGVSEPSGSGSVVGQAGQANGVARQADVVNPDGSGVGGSGPTEPTSAAGQAGGVNAVGRQTDMVVPMLEPMVCVTNRNPMDLSIEEAKKYMRTE